MSAPAAIAFATSPELRIPPSAISGTPSAAQARRALVDRGHLRDADAGDDAGRADRARARCPTFTPSTPASISASAASAVATLPATSWTSSRDQPPRHLDDAARVPVRGVEHEHVDARGDERLGALDRVRADADRGADAQAALLVLRRVRVLDPLRDVLDGDQAPSGGRRRRRPGASRPCCGGGSAPPRRASSRPAR